MGRSHPLMDLSGNVYMDQPTPHLRSDQGEQSNNIHAHYLSHTARKNTDQENTSKVW